MVVAERVAMEASRASAAARSCTPTVETAELAVLEQTAAPQVVVRQVLWDTQVVSRCLSSPQAPQSAWAVVGLLDMQATEVMAAPRLLQALVEVAAVV